MTRKGIYRIILIGCLAATLVLLGYYGIQAMNNQVPDHMNIMVGETEYLSSALPIEMEPEDESIAANFSTAPQVQEGQLNKTQVAMHATETGSFTMKVKLFGIFPWKSVQVDVINNNIALTPSGLPVGISMETDGLLVLGTGRIEGADGLNYEPALSLLQTGDYILGVNGTAVNSKHNLVKRIQDAGGENVTLTVRRNGEETDLLVAPVKSSDGQYKIGAWIRDDTQGIGTITYVDSNKRFGALGHGITDVDTGILMELKRGDLYPLTIVDIKKGTKGNPGEIVGFLETGKEEKIGEILSNSSKGIFGSWSEKETSQNEYGALPIALKQEIEKGPATILSGIDGTVKEYEIEIEKLYLNSDSANKGMVIHVTDENLLSLSGGIVQGMSGSPILQNGKIIGAVTHVFVKDSTRGFGIFIENMLSEK
ncbi:SpoIVB peptidase [Anaerolentibacter hominis]|uniref:SpoIVB peptidase n=1 Tax=Anaerolentibacter hominis TaxID=3079009 RepID=UPI0031B88878